MSGLFELFRASAQRFSGNPALDVGGCRYTYEQLYGIAVSVASAIRTNEQTAAPVAAFLAYRSLGAYASVLGILCSGKGYVPLHPNFPVQRTVRMLQASEANVLLVSEEAASVAADVLAAIDGDMTVVCLGFAPSPELAGTAPRRHVVQCDLQPVPAPWWSVAVQLDDVAYVLFTSGTTGMPKGVPITHGNVLDYLAYVGERYSIRPDDRFSQTFDMTFDLSVHDQFLCWSGGACLYCLPPKVLLAPARFIRQNKLSVWFSVPSLAMLVHRMRMLKTEAFPDLRISLFCGEALPASLAQAWQNAAPNSIIENLYGPTEATIACSHYRWTGTERIEELPNAIVPIGTIFPTQAGCVINTNGVSVQEGEAGELCVSGTQVAPGYLNDAVRTRQRFITIPGTGERIWYRTGDLVRQHAETGCLYYLGRLDDQVQVCGFRVELQEIDAVLRQVSGTHAALAVAWPLNDGRADAVYGFVSVDHDCDMERLRAECARVLPEYMVPRQIFTIPEIPKNSNGKMDRGAVARTLEALLRE